jgi:hypothetical protein
MPESLLGVSVAATRQNSADSGTARATPRLDGRRRQAELPAADFSARDRRVQGRLGEALQVAA